MVTAEPPDEELVARVRAGETEPFELLMRRHNTRLYRIVRSVLRNEAEAEDVMQDAYVIGFTHLSQLSASGSFATWIRTIAFNEALRRARRIRGSPFSEADLNSIDPPSPSQSPEAAAGGAQLKAAMEQAIDALPDGYREVFMLRAVDGCSVADTAEVLGIEEATVKTRLFRARNRLQETLATWLDAEAPRSFDFPATRCDRIVAGVLQRLRAQTR
jgi:RNA polymerase sigma-70 factor, ECF subfamily